MNRVSTLGKFIALVLVSVIAPSAFGQVYRCPDAQGRVILQQAPCVGGSQLNVRPASGLAPEAEAGAAEPSAAKPVTEADRINARTYASQRERRKFELENRGVPEADMAIANARRECQTQLNELEASRGSARNNLAGATYLQSVAAQMQVVATRCDTQERALRDGYDRLLRECKQLGGCALMP